MDYYKIMEKQGLTVSVVACALNTSDEKMQEILELDNPIDGMDCMQIGEFARVLGIDIEI